jgi:hypothetical protein
MVVLTLAGKIPTNTTAFQEFASDLLATKAQAVADPLGLPAGSMQRQKITQLEVVPGSRGPTAYAMFDKRYLFKIYNGSTWFFRMKSFC